MIYEPVEDSKLIGKEVRKCSFGSVLDIGTGSGYLIDGALKNSRVKSVLGVDIQDDVVLFCTEKFKDNENVKILKSDLFSEVKGKFDTIIFNPPYLPFDEREDKESRYTTTGGKKGYELLVKFLDHANDYLKDEGKIIILFSSLTKKYVVDQNLEENLFSFREVSKQKIFMETLYVYVVKKRDVLKRISKKVSSLSLIAKGKRGMVFLGTYNNKKCAIKVVKEGSHISNRVKIEADFLKKLNKKGIGPKLLYSEDDFIIMEFIEGITIKQWVKDNGNPQELRKIIDVVTKKMQIMDSMGINKEEMMRPWKHVLIGKEVRLVDFERCNHSENPKNMRQLKEFLKNLNI